MDGSVVFSRWCQCALHLIHAFLSPSESTIQTASRSVQPFFAGLTIVTERQTDRQTDHATLSLTVGRICVRSTEKLIQRTQWVCYMRIALCVTVLSYKQTDVHLKIIGAPGQRGSRLLETELFLTNFEVT